MSIMADTRAFKCLVLLPLVGLLSDSAAQAAPVAVRVMTYNIWVGGGKKKGTPISRTVDVIKAAKADIVGIQEHFGVHTALARALKFEVVALTGKSQLRNSIAILSRYPIRETAAYGATIEIAKGKKIVLYNFHLKAYPYGPYDIRDNPALTADALIKAARKARTDALEPALQQIRKHLSAGTRVFVTGDFNEASCLDWIPATSPLHFSRVVKWPTTAALQEIGLTDAYRRIHPDPRNKPAFTWTSKPPKPGEPDKEVHDRIDYVFCGGPGIKPLTAEIVGESAKTSDIVVTPYPSDHRAVVVTFEIQ